MSDRVEFVGGPVDGTLTTWAEGRTRMVVPILRSGGLRERLAAEGDVLTACDVEEHVYLRHTAHPEFAYYVYPR